MTKEECLARWKAAAPKRRAYAQQVMQGKRPSPRNIPQWKQYDLEAEIDLLVEERDAQKADYKAAMRRRKERADL